MTVAHCLIMGVQEEFSRPAALKPGMFQLLQDAHSFFFLAGEFLCEDVVFEGTAYPRAVFLPEVCNLPIGMCWPVDIGYKAFHLSIQGAMGPAAQVFQQMLLDMESTLVEWFQAIEERPAEFSVLSCPFLDFYDHYFPAIDTGKWPSVIVD
jgi:hypothetical protein